MSRFSFDYLGNPFSHSDPDIVSGVNDFVGGFLTYQTRTARVVPVADAKPHAALANIYAAAAQLFLENSEAPSLAAPYLARAAKTAEHPRERKLLRFVDAWARGDIDAALGISRSILAQWPQDLATLKLHQYLAFNRGDAPEMLRAAFEVSGSNQEVAQFHGMLAFAFEQCHLLDEAASAARRALQLEPNEPWAQHALAHVYLTRGEIADGVTFLEDASKGWIGLNSFMHTHAWWHLALFYLSQGRFSEARDIYDRDVWGVNPSYSQDQVGAVSLLARLEFAGVDVGDRWDDIAAALAVRAHDVVLPFLSLQYLYGLERAGRPEAAALLKSIDLRAAGGDSADDRVWSEVAHPLAHGISAYLRGEPNKAVSLLRQGIPRLIEIGGSHAQRDLFDQILLAAVLAAGRWSDAQQMLEARREIEPESVPLNRQLAVVYRHLGLPALAIAAVQRGGTAAQGQSGLSGT